MVNCWYRNKETLSHVPGDMEPWMLEGEHSGWKNWATWNVAKWLIEDDILYEAAKEHARTFKQRRGFGIYKSFAVYIRPPWTPDGARWIHHKLDYQALNELMRELRTDNRGAREARPK